MPFNKMGGQTGEGVDAALAPQKRRNHALDAERHPAVLPLTDSIPPLVENMEFVEIVERVE
jgi:hypothetical protein